MNQIETMDITLICIELLLAGFLFWLAHFAEKYRSSKLKLFYTAPFVVAMLGCAFGGSDLCLAGMYLGALILLAGFFWEKKRIRLLSASVAAVLILTAIPLSLFSPAYRAVNYTGEFKKAFSTMQRYYVLTDHKKIDWDDLYERYLPRFQEATRTYDQVENYIAWKEFCNEFHDGHVGYEANEAVTKQASDKLYGNDYGLSLMTLCDGRNVAVNVEPGSVAAGAGIRNGSIITAWNGEKIEELKKQNPIPAANFPDKETEDFYSALYVAGMGEDSADVSFLNDDGAEQTVSLPKRGSYFDRLKETIDTIHKGVDAGTLSFSQINDDTACLRVKVMMYDQKTYETGDHSQMQSELRSKLLELKEQGVKQLVIDLRGNSGGSPHFSAAIAALFAAPGEHTAAYDGVWDEHGKCFARDEATGSYVVGPAFTYNGENVWEGRPVIVLVNAFTISSGDLLTMLLSRCENVKVVGFTRSNSSCQAIRGIDLAAGSLTFSAVPTLNADGSAFIDTDETRVSNMPLDVKVPFDEDAVHMLFDEDGDYLLDQALTLFAESE